MQPSLYLGRLRGPSPARKVSGVRTFKTGMMETFRPVRLAVLVLVCALMPVRALAQGGAQTGAVAGVVKDKDGTLPGATVFMKKVSTGETIGPVVTDENGEYAFRDLSPGSYTVTITMNNYHTIEVALQVLAGEPQSVVSMLEVGKR